MFILWDLEHNNSISTITEIELSLIFWYVFGHSYGLLDLQSLVRISITNYNCIVMHNKYCLLHDVVFKNIIGKSK